MCLHMFMFCKIKNDSFCVFLTDPRNISHNGKEKSETQFEQNLKEYKKVHKNLISCFIL